MGAAAGLALTGKRPVAELMFADFIGVSLDQIWNQLAKFRYMFGGKTKCPAVIRMAYGAGYNAAAQHSQAVHQILTGDARPQSGDAHHTRRCKRPAAHRDPR